MAELRLAGPDGAAIRRPRGQTRSGDADPVFGPAKSLDYELELGSLSAQEMCWAKPSR